MTTQTPKPDNSDAPNDSSTERRRYFGTGTGHMQDTISGALFDDKPSLIHLLESPVDRVNLGIVVGEETTGSDPHISASINLSPGDAEDLARDIFKAAAEAREEQDNE